VRDTRKDEDLGRRKGKRARWSITGGTLHQEKGLNEEQGPHIKGKDIDWLHRPLTLKNV